MGNCFCPPLQNTDESREHKGNTTKCKYSVDAERVLSSETSGELGTTVPYFLSKKTIGKNITFKKKMTLRPHVWLPHQFFLPKHTGELQFLAHLSELWCCFSSYLFVPVFIESQHPELNVAPEECPGVFFLMSASEITASLLSSKQQ